MIDMITVQTNKPYSIYIGTELLQNSGKYIQELHIGRKAAIITDDTVAGLYLSKVTASLEEAGIPVCSYIFPHGEQSKNHTTLFDIYDFLTEHDITRSDFLVALGGGVVGDVAGYAAATYLRGLPFVQIPTTFLAQIDSSVGGKTGVDTNKGKNLVGCFHQPSLVLCDTDTLSTLSEEIFQDGISEAIKYGMILDQDLFNLIKNGALKQELHHVICRCIDLKRILVEKDERDNGDRMLLNFGHTVGHALENYFHYSITHGKGVAVGMVIMMQAASAAGFCDKSSVRDLMEALKAYHIPCYIDADYEKVCALCLHDKKRADQILRIILVNEIGHGTIYPIPASEFQAFIIKGAYDGMKSEVI